MDFSSETRKISIIFVIARILSKERTFWSAFRAIAWIIAYLPES
jgi:hypothetical protein